MIGMIKKTWSYTRNTKNTCKKIFIGGFIFKEYEDNSKDKMHWMRSYEIGLLIISNYIHHLHKNIIIHHVIYLKNNNTY